MSTLLDRSHHSGTRETTPRSVLAPFIARTQRLQHTIVRQSADIALQRAIITQQAQIIARQQAALVDAGVVPPPATVQPPANARPPAAKPAPDAKPRFRRPHGRR